VARFTGTLEQVDWNAELVRGDLGRPFSNSSGSRARGCSSEVWSSHWRWRSWIDRWIRGPGASQGRGPRAGV